jgi:hypothetical protein
VDKQQDPRAIKSALAAPFDPREVHFRPAAVSGHRALALAYVSTQAVEDRLDSVLGVNGWQDDYEVLPGGCVVCRLKVLLGGQWLVKSDVGAPGELPEEGDRQKTAFSQALKRAAVKWGVARYLYRLPPQWVDYDPATGQFITTPRLPDCAIPTCAPRETTSDSRRPETIGAGQEKHLRRLLALKGYRRSKLARRYGVEELSQLSVEQYRHAVEHLSKLPDRVAVD